LELWKKELASRTLPKGVYVDPHCSDAFAVLDDIAWAGGGGRVTAVAGKRQAGIGEVLARSAFTQQIGEILGGHR